MSRPYPFPERIWLPIELSTNRRDFYAPNTNRDDNRKKVEFVHFLIRFRSTKLCAAVRLLSQMRGQTEPLQAFSRLTTNPIYNKSKEHYRKHRSK